MKIKLVLLFLVLGVFNAAFPQERKAPEKRWEELSKSINYKKGKKELIRADRYYSEPLKTNDLEESSYNDKSDPSVPRNQKISEEEIINSRNNRSTATQKGNAPLRIKEVNNRLTIKKKEIPFQKIDSSPPNIENTKSWKTILIVFAILLAIVLIYFIFFNSGKSATLTAAAPDMKSNIDPSAVEEDEYTRQLRAALAEKDYRLALRINYLMALRALIQKGYITWGKDKTNAEYLLELRKYNFHVSFQHLVRAFDRVWYGHYTINADSYVHFENSSNQFIAVLEKDEQ